jgi:uncharacterized SAM-binding protein YcdF (DUF218 family)
MALIPEGRSGMFFYLAKVFWFFAQPSGLLLLLLLMGSALLRAGRDRVGRRLVAASAGLLLFGGWLPVSNWLMLPLEQRFSRAAPASEVDGIVVLGGAEEARIWLERSGHALNEAGERFTETIALARRYPKAKVVFTGGASELLTASKVGADAARAIFADLGLAEGERLMLERTARDTWENAVLAKALAQPKAGEHWLLVTSAWHMPRAIGAFRKAGFSVEPWPVDYRTASLWDALRPFEAPADGLKRFDTALREWIGLAVYRAIGRSSALFPGPS